MAKEFRLPDLGEGVHEGQIIKLLVAEGDPVKEDQPLMEVETDKAAVEIPSPTTGTIAKWHVAEQQTVSVGDVMVTFGHADGAASAKPDQAATPAASDTVSSQSSRSRSASSSASATASKPHAQARRTPASPAVRKLARDMGVDIESINGTGPAGRVTRRDVEASAGSNGSSQSAPVPAPSRTTSPASPPRPATPPQPIAPAGSPIPKADGRDQYGSISRVPLTQARKTIAAVMSQSMATIPHVTDSDDADVTDLNKLRRDFSAQESAADQPKLTMLAFIIRAVARALQKFPEFNASFDADQQQIIYRHYINIAIGVHTERGLVAPVIRDADQLDVMGIAAALADITEKARTASFAVNDTRGGTYTISNAGAFGGSRYSTPLITPPQVAVLAIGRSRMMPWVVDGEIVPRLIMPLSHSIDHRLLDGGQEIAFMKHVIADLEQPGRLIWEHHGRR
jgi:pyruvate dehydrogenase E2 component (dihydrolipoamide acetyltransferase)